MKHIRFFVASSGSLSDDRRELEVLIRRLNDRVVTQQIYVDLVLWETMSRAFSPDRKQNEFNKAIESADLFVCLIHDRVGEFTREELDWAIEHFRHAGSPRIVVLFKSALIDPTTLGPEFSTVIEARKVIRELGQIWDVYANAAELCRRIEQELAELIDPIRRQVGIADGCVNESNQVLIDLFDPSGKRAYLYRTTHVKALEATRKLNDRITTDGEVKWDTYVVNPGRFVRRWREDAWYVETALDDELPAGGQLLRLMAVELRDAFLETSEYWMDRQLGRRELMSIEVRFPSERPPISWHSERTVAYEKLSAPIVCRFEINGRPALRIQAVGEVPFEVYSLKWTW